MANAVATAKKNELVDNNAFFGQMAAYDGAGSEDVTFSDRKTPIYSLVEPLSKAVKKNSDKFIEGAEVGDIIDTSVRTIIGKEFDFVPVKFTTEWLEWQEERGNAPMRHKSADILDECEWVDTATKKGFFLPNGNEVQETKIFYGIDVTNGTWAVLSMAKGRLGAARLWVEKLERIKNPQTGHKAAYFIQVWNVKSMATTSRGGDDYNTYDAAFKCWVNEYPDGMAAFEEAKALSEALAKETVSADFEAMAKESAPSDDGAM